MAGIFGGQASGVDARNNKRCNFRSSILCSISDCGTCKDNMVYITDSSHRFERGVDFTLPTSRKWKEQQHCYLTFVVAEAGEICEVVSEQYLPKVNEVTLRREKLDSLLGSSY